MVTPLKKSKGMKGGKGKVPPTKKVFKPPSFDTHGQQSGTKSTPMEVDLEQNEGQFLTGGSTANSHSLEASASGSSPPRSQGPETSSASLKRKVYAGPTNPYRSQHIYAYDLNDLDDDGMMKPPPPELRLFIYPDRGGFGLLKYHLTCMFINSSILSRKMPEGVHQMRKLSKEQKTMLFNEFKWNPAYDYEMRRLWNVISSKQYRDKMDYVRQVKVQPKRMSRASHQTMQAA